MTEITRYVLVGTDYVEGDYEYESYREALVAAQSVGDTAIIERTYVYDDSALVYTPNGAGTWPPEIEKE